MKHKSYIAADLGASNGRTFLGRFDGTKLTLEELSRFENHYIRISEEYYSEILIGLKKEVKATNGVLGGIGIDVGRGLRINRQVRMSA